MHDTYGEHEAKLPAGDLLVYSATSVHEVHAGNARRAGLRLLLEPEHGAGRRPSRRSSHPGPDHPVTAREARGTAECVALTSHYHNLLRLWAET